MSGVRVVPGGRLSDPDRVAADLGIADDAAPGSLLDRLRQRATEVQRERRLDLPVPGWQGELVLRFRPLDMGSLDRLVAARGRGNASEVSEGIDAMATCCVAVLGRDGEHLTELADDAGPVGLEHRLAVLLAMPVPPGATLTIREVVGFLFGGNAFALGQFVDRFVTWMQDPDAAEPVGESSAGHGSTP